jgi:hypothetical protein
MLDAWIYGYYCDVGGRYFSNQSQVSGHVREILTICFKGQGTGVISFDSIFLSGAHLFSLFATTYNPIFPMVPDFADPLPLPLPTGYWILEEV